MFKCPSNVNAPEEPTNRFVEIPVKVDTFLPKKSVVLPTCEAGEVAVFD